MLFYLYICLFLLPLFHSQETSINELYPNLIRKIEFIGQDSPAFSYHLPNTPNLTVSLIFTAHYPSDLPNFDVYFFDNNTKILHECDNPLEFNKPCLYNVISANEQINVKFTCESILSRKCTIWLRMLILEGASLYYDEPMLNTIGGRDDDKCHLKQIKLPRSIDAREVILSIATHNIDIHDVFSKENNIYNLIQISDINPSITYLTDKIVLVISQSEIAKCEKCNISLVLCTESQIFIEFKLRSYAPSQLLYINDDYIDYIDYPNLMNYYHISLDEHNMLNTSQIKLSFMLTTLTGSSKSMYIHGDFAPNNIKDYQFNSSLLDYYQEEDIIITKEDIDLYSFGGKNFYISVKSNYPGLFRLTIQRNDNIINELNLGTMENRAIKTGDIHYYGFLIWASASEDGPLICKVTVEVGNIEIYGRECASGLECSLITDEDIKTHNQIDFQGDSKEGNKMLKLSSKCKDNNNYCYILIAVKGFSSFVGLNRYSLLLSRENSVINLVENIRHDSHIELNSILRYKLEIKDNENMINTIKFTLNADLPYYSSKDKSCYDGPCADFLGNTRNPIIYKQPPFTGTYYIFITGMKSSDFSLYPEVLRKNTISNEISLAEGKPFKAVINENNMEYIFSFLINSEEDIDVEVIIQGSKNKLEMQIMNGRRSTFGWITTENVLEFKHFNTNEKLYRVIIKALDVDLQHKNLEFSVFYATDKTLRIIEKNKLLYETLKPLSFKYYMFYLDMEEDSCIVTRHVINPRNSAINLELYLSELPYPEKNYSLYQAEATETSRIVLKQEDVKKICGNNSNSHHCPVYISLYNSNAKEDIVFSLLAYFQNKAIEITEGLEQRFNLNHKEEVLRGYFLPNSKNSSLDLYFYTENEKFEVFLSVFDDLDHLALYHHYFYNFPNKTSYDYYSHENNQHSLMLKPQSFDFCWPDCVLLFTITYLLQYQDSTTLSILISSNYTEIIEGKPMVFSLNSDEFKYFYYRLDSFLKDPEYLPNSTIQLTMTPFYGSADMYLSITHDQKTDKPTEKLSDFYLYIEHFTLSKKSIIKRLQSYLTNVTKLYSNAKLTIGVFSHSEGKFMISIAQSLNLLHSIYPGSPQEVLLKNQSERYFQYYFREKEYFKVYFNRESGIGLCGISACSMESLAENSSVYKECLRKPKVALKLITGTGSSYFVISEKTIDNFCQNCYYLAQIQSINGDLKGSLIIKEPDTMIYLQEGRKFYDHLEINEENRFSFWSSAYEVLQVLLTVYQGDPILYHSQDYNPNKEDYKSFYKKKPNSNNIQFLIAPKINYFDKPKNDSGDIPAEWKHHISNYILVSCESVCEYSVSYIAGGTQVLQGGVIHSDNTRPMESKSYTYNQLEDYPSFLTINFEDELNFTKSYELTVKYRAFNEMSEFQANEMEDIQLTQNYKSDKTVSFKLPSNKTGTYFFNLTSLQMDITKRPAKYWIAVNARDFSIIPYDTILPVYLEQNSIRFYEIYIAAPGFVVMDLLECYGNVQLLVTKDYHKLLLEDYEEDFKPVIGHSFIHVMKADEVGMMYFALKSGLDSVVLEFSVRYYEKYNQIPQIRFTIQDQGHINWFFDFYNNSFSISFHGLSCEDCDQKELNDIQVDYYIIAHNNGESLKYKGKCGVEMADIIEESTGVSKSLGKLGLDINFIWTSLSLDFDQTNYITVKAVVTGDTVGKFQMFYPTIEIPVVRKHHRLAFYIIVTAIVIIILGCCVMSVYFWRKYKNISKKLRYEMEDVRNVAQMSAVNTSIEMENKKYQGLVDENQ